MELGTGIARILGTLVIGRAILYIELVPGAREV